MQPLVIIPARFASVRFPGKPLFRLTSSEGISRPLVEWTWRAAVAAVGSPATCIATDDERIADAARAFGARVVLTDRDLRNGTERCAAAVAALGQTPSVVVNLQGDSPLIPPQFITAVLAAFGQPAVQVATPFVECDAAMMALIHADHAAGRVGGTCVVARDDGTAAYFSKYPIPHGASAECPLKLHLGLYAFRPAALAAYAALPPGALEHAEGLEQLRFLEAGWPIQLVKVPRPRDGMWEINNPEDVAIVEPRLPLSHIAV
ncbi:MAG: 3-deoxy-manno-octulosonate cytidylyltransferase [Pseudomonadota bacterium]